MTPGETCWRIAPADRAAFIIDYQNYYAAVVQALAGARRSIWLLGWGFDPRARLAPDGHEGESEPDEIGNVLLELARTRPELDIRILVWKSALPVAISQDFFPHRAARWFRGSTVRFVLDDKVPFGACHHQKALVIDGVLAFSGGGDISVDRFDTVGHLPADPRRIRPNGHRHPARHEVMVAVDGKAGAVLAEHFAMRWFAATEESIVIPTGEPSPWPDCLTPSIEDVPMGVSRTDPAWPGGSGGVCEIERLILRSIADAQRCIYLENQYFTSPVIGEALAARLAEPDGPEIVLISTGRSPSYFDQLTMDRARSVLLWRLRAADIFGRFRAFSPVTADGEAIIVHAKTTVIDDRLVRIGSANLNNRSLGFDTELELAFEAQDEPGRVTIEAFRDRLAGHYMGVGATEVARARADNRGLIGAIETLNRGRRLRPIEPLKMGAFGEFVAHFHLGDPYDPHDSWRLGRRRDRLFAKARDQAQLASVKQLEP